MARSRRYFVTEMVSKAWFLLRTMENLSRFEKKKKNSNILHVTEFPALQQILELYSDPNVAETRGITIWGWFV